MISGAWQVPSTMSSRRDLPHRFSGARMTSRGRAARRAGRGWRRSTAPPPTAASADGQDDVPGEDGVQLAEDVRAIGAGGRRAVMRRLLAGAGCSQLREPWRRASAARSAGSWRSWRGGRGTAAGSRAGAAGSRASGGPRRRASSDQASESAEASRCPYRCKPRILTPNPCRRVMPRACRAVMIWWASPVAWRRHTDPSPTRGSAARSIPAAAYRSAHRRYSSEV